MMKRCIYALTAAMIVLSCSGYDDGPIRNRINELNEKIGTLEELAVTLNSEILSVRSFFLAADNGDVIKSCKAFQDEDGLGYIIEFVEAGPIKVHNGKNGEDEGSVDGVDGIAPVVGITKEDDGRWYWTLNGEIFLDELGYPVCLTMNADNGEDGKVPQLRVHDGIWEVSYNGNRWDKVAGADDVPVPDKVGGMYFFTAVKEEEECYVFTLGAEQESVRIPKLATLNLVLSGYEGLKLAEGITSYIAYTVEGATSRTKVYAISNSRIKVSVEADAEDVFAGRIVFYAYKGVVDGDVLVYADDGYGNTSMRMFSFKAGVPDIIGVEGFDGLTDFDNWGIDKKDEEVPSEDE